MNYHKHLKIGLGLMITTIAAISLAACTSTPAAPTPQPVAKNLIVLSDTVRGPVGLSDAQKTSLSCVQQNRYPQGAQIVWRVRVIDPSSGNPMDDQALKNVTLTLPDGTKQELKYGKHADDSFWTTSFAVPANYPTGSFNAKVEATDAKGRTGANLVFNVAPSLMQIVPAGQS